MKEKKSILITAPTSIVASNFIRYLGDRYDVTTIGRRESEIKFDFAKDTYMEIPDHMDAIVHFAAALNTSNDVQIMDMIRTNIQGTLSVCISAKRCGIKQVVYISSISASLSDTSEYYDFYSLTKRQAEEVAKLYCKKNNIKLCIIRPSQIFGVDCRYKKNQPLLYLMIQNALENKQINIYGKHDALRNYIFADNLFKIIEEVIERECANEIEVIDKKNYHLSEIAEIIIETFNSSSKVVFLDDKKNISDNQFDMKINYFEKWKIPFIDFKEAIEQIASQRLFKYVFMSRKD